MKAIFWVLILIFLFSSCKKEGNDDFIWEKSFGQGDALFIRSTPDSGFVSCGELNSKPYLIKLSKDRKVIVDISLDNEGLFSSAWSDKSGYIAAGNAGGKMILARFSPSGVNVWDTSITTGFKVDRTTLCYMGDGNLLAVATAIPDSANSGATGLFFISLDSTGHIIQKKEITETNFISANKADVDNAGNIYLPLTRKTAAAKPKASVAKFNSDFQKLWETELYNNPNFGAATLDINLDASGNIYVSGKTELSSGESVLNNSFLASLSGTGAIRWKQYHENINEGIALVINDDDILMMLNTNCFAVNMVSPLDGTYSGKIRIFDACDSKTTDAFGRDMDVTHDGNILVAGSKGGSFFLALKSSL
ncbi:MAG: hypothetical protein MUO72_04545 [Bacteroidales bacterium]|nr:hypothetical protein [Bacteroidales bacterium]